MNFEYFNYIELLPLVLIAIYMINCSKQKCVDDLGKADLSKSSKLKKLILFLAFNKFSSSVYKKLVSELKDSVDLTIVSDNKDKDGTTQCEGVKIAVDKLINEINPEDFDGMIVTGKDREVLKRNIILCDRASRFWKDKDKFIGSVCEENKRMKETALVKSECKAVEVHIGNKVILGKDSTITSQLAKAIKLWAFNKRQI